MGELKDMDCGDLADVAAELALGVLTGRERADAVAYLDQCDACRENVRQLTVTGEELLGLVPSREPPTGFETRVLDRLGFTEPSYGRSGPRHGRPRPAPRSRWLLAAAAGAVIVAAAGLGGWGLHGSAPARPGTASGPPRSTLTWTALTSATHQDVGSIFLYRGAQAWLYMTVDTETGNGQVICDLKERNGHILPLGSFKLSHGYGYWGHPEPVPVSQVVGAQLTSTSGKVLATASLTTTK
jgi:hypothetical protein